MATAQFEYVCSARKSRWGTVHASVLVAMALVCLTGIGCGGGSSQQEKSGNAGLLPQIAAQSTSGISPRDTWDALFLAGDKIGYVHTQVQVGDSNGTQVIRTEAESRMRLLRANQLVQVVQRLTSVERATGDVISLACETEMEGGTRQFSGKVVGDVLKSRLTVDKTEQSSDLPWPTGTRGFFAVEQSLRRQPMRAGEHRKLRSFQPLLHQICEVELTAGDWEDVGLPSGVFRLLRIHSVQKMIDGTVAADQQLWVNPDGEVFKSYAREMSMEMYRTTREIAQNLDELPKFDLGLDVAVPVENAGSLGHATRFAEYDVVVEGSDDAASLFSHCASQSVESQGGERARITVRAIRPGDTLPGIEPASLPTPGDSQPSNLIQSDDPQIVELAGSVAVGIDDPWQIAVALERKVHEVITEKDFSQVFASAAEVAASCEGDCTEHAVLLAALCRARGIPARVAIGLIYSPAAGGFLYHMWDEVWIDGRWVALDATLGRGGIGAAHLKVTDSNLQGASAYSSILPILSLIGRLKVRVILARS